MNHDLQHQIDRNIEAEKSLEQPFRRFTVVMSLILFIYFFQGDSGPVGEMGEPGPDGPAVSLQYWLHTQ